MNEISRRAVLKAGAAMALAPALQRNIVTLAADAGPYDDAILMPGEPPVPEAGAFTIAVLPDTQYYSERFPETFAAQTHWIVENQRARNIACVLHLGDITDHNRPAEWENAVKAMSLLDGKVPYFMVPGNHDYSENGSCQDRSTRLSEYFPVSRFQSLPTFGGVYDREPEHLANSYHRFTAEDRKFLVLALEFGPRQDVLRWANDIVRRHADREVILITHAHIYYDDSRYDWKKRGTTQSWNPHAYGVSKSTNDDVNDGEEVWGNLISKHENFLLTLNGHVLGDGLGKVSTATPAGREVHQLLVNFQMRPNGGDGWLRLLEFRPDGQTIQVYDYSPTRKERNASPQNQFTLTTPKATA